MCVNVDYSNYLSTVTALQEFICIYLPDYDPLLIFLFFLDELFIY